MEFRLTEDQKIIQESVRRFVESEIEPRSNEWDLSGNFHEEGVAGLVSLGMMGMFVDPEHGGSGLDITAGMVVIEEIARRDGALALTVATHNLLAAGHFALAGNDDQKSKWLGSLAAGEVLGAWAQEGEVKAEKKGDGFVLNGTKQLVTQGSRAGVYVVLAEGPTAFILEPNLKGFEREPVTGKLGMRGADSATLTFTDLELPESAVLGEVGKGGADAALVLSRANIALAALGVGLARGCLEESRNYALERKQFKKPIGDFQAIQWMLADMSTEIDAARLLVHRAADLADRGESVELAAAQAKLFAANVSVRAGMKAVQIHGGNGYTREYKVERYLRDAKYLQLGEGTAEDQKITIARHICEEVS